MLRLFSLFAALTAALLTPLAAAAQQPDYSRWAAVVVAADWRAGGGAEAPIFDNARRGVVAMLQRQGFNPQNIAQMTSASEPEPGMPRTDVPGFERALADTTARAPAGCLLYFTSHGAPQGIVFGRGGGLSPGTMASLVNRYCGDRPSVVVVSACYSGVFVPVLAADNRMVLTAARPDRTSFGCGASNVMPYFDECVLQMGRDAGDWPSLGAAAQTCVAIREAAEGLTPPSEPQLSVGNAVAPILTGGRMTAGVQSSFDDGPQAQGGKGVIR